MFASSGGINTWGVFPSRTRLEFIEGVATFLCQAGWEVVEETVATVTATFTTIANNNTIAIAGITYTFKTTINNANANEVLVGATTADSLDNLIAALNHDAGSGTLYSTPTDANDDVTATRDGLDLTITARDAGPVGSGFAFSSAITSPLNGLTQGGGYRLRGLAPQFRYTVDTELMSVILYIFDDQEEDAGMREYVTMRLEGVVYPESKTRDHLIHVDPSFEHRIICNRCQFFIYREGIRSSAFGSVMCGGVPWVPNKSLCSGEVPAQGVDEIFWISSDRAGLSAPEISPRTCVQGLKPIHSVSIPDSTSGFVGTEDRWDSTDGVYNGNMIYGSVHTDGRQPRMLSITPPNAYLTEAPMFSGTAVLNTIYWWDEQPMLLEPMFGWGNEGSNDDLIARCQFYDAWIHTKQYIPTQDTIRDLDNRVIQPFEMFGQEGYWLPFTYESKFGTLCLLVPNPDPTDIDDLEGNYCY